MESRKLLYSERRALAAIIGLTLLATATEAGFLVIAARVGVALANGDHSITVHDDTTITMATGLTLAAVFVAIRFVASITSAAVSSRSMARASVRIRAEFTDAYLCTAWEVKHALAPGRVQQLLSSYTRTSVNVVTAAARGLTAVVSLAALTAVAMLIQPHITLTAATLVVGLGLAMVPLRRRVQETSELAAATQLDFGTRVNEMESLALEIEVHGVGDAVAARIASAATEAVEANGRS